MARFDPDQIEEVICGLPVQMPAELYSTQQELYSTHSPSQQAWLRREFLHPQGHPIFQAGLAVDEYFRPLGLDGTAAYNNLFAAGSILAGADPIRESSLEGIALASAYAVAENLAL